MSYQETDESNSSEFTDEELLNGATSGDTEFEDFYEEDLD